jgi:hypothetical protein
MRAQLAVAAALSPLAVAVAQVAEVEGVAGDCIVFGLN